MKIDLPAEASQFIDGLVASGEYASRAEVVVEGVRLLMSRQPLRLDIQKGIDELNIGEGIDGKQVFAELRERAETSAQQAN